MKSCGFQVSDYANQLPAIPIRRSTRLTANYWLLGEIGLTASDLTEDQNAKACTLVPDFRRNSCSLELRRGAVDFTSGLHSWL